MRIISYNLRKNRAIGELESLVRSHSVDTLCLQEVDPATLPERVGSLELVHATSRNRLGLAMYVDSERYEVRAAKTFELKKSLHDRVLAPADERLLGVRLHDRETDRGLVAASFHAAPLTAPNSLRRTQIHAALRELSALGAGVPQLMVGDYNYPVFQDRLTAVMKAAGYETAFSDKRTYTRYLVFRGHYDFATSQGFDISKVSTLPQGLSDHLPILVEAHAREDNRQTPMRDTIEAPLDAEELARANARALAAA